MKAKRHLFLTGHPGTGKTTIIVNTILNLQKYMDISRIDNSNKKYRINMHGFYTEECRNSNGDRIGFDIIYWNEWSKDKNEEAFDRVPLSRSLDKIKKSDPHVGKYLVNLEHVEQYAIPTIIPATTNVSNGERTDQLELIIVDEIGKMEMLCPNFLPTVMTTLDSTTKNDDMEQIVFGTIPTPRYGRVIPAIEEIRARDDVMVVHVTKDNRDELGKHIFDCFKKLVTCDEDYTFEDMSESLKPFLYKREIGASSMERNESTKKNLTTKQQKIEDEGSTKTLIPCGPLVSDKVKPKILLVGETASEEPKNNELAYCERSMWRILGTLHNIQYCPSPPEKADMKTFTKLKTKVISQKICIWDVLSNVHVKKLKRNKRQRNSKLSKPNDIGGFLNKHPSIEVICFIGKKAHTTFLKVSEDSKMEVRDVDLIILPSSSASNSRMTNEEKALNWDSSFSKYYF